MSRHLLFLLVLASPALAGDMTIYRIEGSSSHCDSSSCWVSASCPVDFYLVGGGVIASNGWVTASLPYGGTWNASVVSDQGSSVRSIAMCADTAPLGYQQRRGYDSDCLQGYCQPAALCPDGWIPISGGVEGFDAGVDASLRVTGGWGGFLRTFGPDPYSSAAVVCSIPPGIALPPPDWAWCPPEGCSLEISCPDGMAIVGGGFYGIESRLISAAPSPEGRWYASWNADTDSYGEDADGYGQLEAACMEARYVNATVFSDGFD